MRTVAAAACFRPQHACLVLLLLQAGGHRAHTQLGQKVVTHLQDLRKARKTGLQPAQPPAHLREILLDDKPVGPPGDAAQQRQEMAQFERHLRNHLSISNSGTTENISKWMYDNLKVDGTMDTILRAQVAVDSALTWWVFFDPKWFAKLVALPSQKLIAKLVVLPSLIPGQASQATNTMLGFVKNELSFFDKVSLMFKVIRQAFLGAVVQKQTPRNPRQNKNTAIQAKVELLMTYFFKCTEADEIFLAAGNAIPGCTTTALVKSVLDILPKVERYNFQEAGGGQNATHMEVEEAGGGQQVEDAPEGNLMAALAESLQSDMPALV